MLRVESQQATTVAPIDVGVEKRYINDTSGSVSGARSFLLDLLFRMKMVLLWCLIYGSVGNYCTQRVIWPFRAVGCGRKANKGTTLQRFKNITTEHE